MEPVLHRSSPEREKHSSVTPDIKSFLLGSSSAPSLIYQGYLLSSLCFDLHGRAFLYGREENGNLFLSVFSPSGDEEVKIGPGLVSARGAVTTIKTSGKLRLCPTPLVDGEGGLWLPHYRSRSGENRVGYLSPGGSWAVYETEKFSPLFVSPSGEIMGVMGENKSLESDDTFSTIYSASVCSPVPGRGPGSIRLKSTGRELNSLHHFVVPSGETAEFWGESLKNCPPAFAAISMVDCGCGFLETLTSSYEVISHHEIFLELQSLRTTLDPERIFCVIDSLPWLYFVEGEKVFRAQAKGGRAERVDFSRVRLRMGRDHSPQVLPLGREFFLGLE